MSANCGESEDLFESRAWNIGIGEVDLTYAIAALECRNDVVDHVLAIFP